MSPNRIVAFLTPLVFAPAAGAIAVWAAEQGLDVDPGRLEEIFIAGAVIALAPALQWLHGWQKHEEREALAASVADRSDAAVAAPVAVAFEDDLTPEELALDEDYEDYEDEDEQEPEYADDWDADPLLADEEPVAAGR